MNIDFLAGVSIVKDSANTLSGSILGILKINEGWGSLVFFKTFEVWPELKIDRCEIFFPLNQSIFGNIFL